MVSFCVLLHEILKASCASFLEVLFGHNLLRSSQNPWVVFASPPQGGFFLVGFLTGIIGGTSTCSQNKIDDRRRGREASPLFIDDRVGVRCRFVKGL
jgi:hypothetical protein